MPTHDAIVKAMTKIQQESGDLWDAEIRESWELELTDISREQFIAERLAAWMLRNQTKTVPTTSINTALDQISHVAFEEDSGYGLQPWLMREFRDILVDHLNLEVIND